VLYFIPKTTRRDAPKKPVSFRDSSQSSKSATIEVLGVSFDSEAKHKKFAQNSIYFRLLADTDRSLPRALAPTAKKSSWEGLIWGIHRMTFLIDEKGKIKKSQQG